MAATYQQIAALYFSRPKPLMFQSLQTPNQRPMLQVRAISDRVDSTSTIGALATTRQYQPRADWSTVQSTSNPLTPAENLGYGLVSNGVNNFQVARAAPSIDHSVIGSAGVGVPVVPQVVRQNEDQAKKQASVPATADTSLDRVFFRNINYRPDQASLYAELVTENKMRTDIHSAALRSGTLKDTMKYQANKEAYAALYRQHLDQLSSLVKQPKMTRQTVGYDKDGKILSKVLLVNPYVRVTRKQREGVLKTRSVRYNKPTDDQRPPPARKDALIYTHPIKDDRATAAIEDEIEAKQIDALYKVTMKAKMEDAKKLRTQSTKNDELLAEFKKRGLVPLVAQDQAAAQLAGADTQPALQSSSRPVAVASG